MDDAQFIQFDDENPSEEITFEFYVWLHPTLEARKRAHWGAHL